MKLSKKLIIIIISVLVLSIGGGVAYATNTPTTRAERTLKLANKYLQEGKYQEAILAFQKVIEIGPKNIPARLGLGQVYVATKEFSKAETVLKEVIDIEQKNISAREALFKVYLKEGNSEAANAILQEIIHIDPNKDVKQLEADLKLAKATSTSKTGNNNSSLATSIQSSQSTSINNMSSTTTETSQSLVTGESDFRERMNLTIFKPEVAEKLKSEGKGTASQLMCYLDTSMNIAYFGMINGLAEPKGANVARVHNPKIISFNEVPWEKTEKLEYFNKLCELGEKYEASKAIIVDDFYYAVCIEGNSFEADLLKAGISPDYIVYFDK